MRSVMVLISVAVYVLVLSLTAPAPNSVNGPDPIVPESVMNYVDRHVVGIVALGPQGDGTARVAVGTGVALYGGMVLTASHTVRKYDPVEVYIIRQGLEHFIRADIILLSNINEDKQNDYALLKPRENLKLSGIKLARTELRKGEVVIFGGSVGGAVFFTRVGFVTYFKHYFDRNADGVFIMKQHTDYSFVTVYPSGPGDSGAGIFNMRGELCGLIFSGVEVHAEHYGFSNPLWKLKEFLAETGLSFE